MPLVSLGGRSIYHSESGAASVKDRGRPPVLLIHGAASSHLVWGFQLAALGGWSRVVAIDLPGHGRSSPPGRRDVDAYRDDVLAFLDASGIEGAVVVGHSMGGAIAQSIALASPGRVSALVLLGTGPRLRVSPAILEGLATDYEATARMIVDNSLSATADATLRSRSLAEFLACPEETARGDFAACAGFDSADRLGGLGMPVLVLCGSEDRMTPPRQSGALAAAMPGAVLVQVEGAGHSLMVEKPAAVNAAILDFLARATWR